METTTIVDHVTHARLAKWQVCVSRVKQTGCGLAGERGKREGQERGGSKLLRITTLYKVCRVFLICPSFTDHSSTGSSEIKSKTTSNLTFTFLAVAVDRSSWYRILFDLNAVGGWSSCRVYCAGGGLQLCGETTPLTTHVRRTFVECPANVKPGARRTFA